MIQRFNSLQTGKPIQSGPSTIPSKSNHILVSIPFKRESLSKETVKLADKELNANSFNSLQTGKPIQS